MSVILGLISAVLFGAADFIGGISARRLHTVVVTGCGALVGGTCLALILAIVGGAWSVQAVAVGAASGVAGAIAISLLYACLAMGPMSILAPVMAVVSALIPTIADIVRGRLLSPAGYVAIAVALVAAVLLGSDRSGRGVRAGRRALGMAAASGAMIGVFLILIDLTPADSGVLPLVANRATNVVIMSATLGVLALRAGRRRPLGLVRGPVPGAWRAGLGLAALGGALDAVANSLTLVALRTGELSVVSVLIALSPAGTALLAAVVLRERASRAQLAGIMLALVGGALFALR